MLAIGNAIVDVIAEVDDAFLVDHELTKDSMQLVEPERAEVLYAAMPPGMETSGGSAANTAVGVAAARRPRRVHRQGPRRPARRGVRARHPGRRRRLRTSPPAPEGPPTARSLIVVTPDAQRTMNTSLGIAGAGRHATTSTSTLVGVREHRLLRGLPLGSRAHEGGDPARRCGVAREARQQGRAHAVRRVLRRAPPGRVPASWSDRRSTSCSPTRPRSDRCTRSSTSTTRCSRPGGDCELSLPDAGRRRASVGGDESTCRRPRRSVDTTGAGTSSPPVRTPPGRLARPTGSLAAGEVISTSASSAELRLRTRRDALLDAGLGSPAAQILGRRRASTHGVGALLPPHDGASTLALPSGVRDEHRRRCARPMTSRRSLSGLVTCGNSRYRRPMNGHVRSRDDRRARATRDRLLDAAAEVFAEKGYDRAGVQEIARRAGLTTGAIYGRFTGKAELLQAAIESRTTDELDELFAQHRFEGRASDILRTVGSHLVTNDVPTRPRGGCAAARGVRRRPPRSRGPIAARAR